MPTPTTTTIGQTSDRTVPAVSHTARLVEEHDIRLPVEAVGDLDAAHRIARMHAEAWARAHQLELINVADSSRSDGTAGVTFDVVVGVGDISLDQRVAGALDSWRWSGPRVSWWRRVFNRADGREGRRIAARVEGDKPGTVVRGPWRGAEALAGPDQGPSATVSVRRPRCSQCYGVGEHRPGCVAARTTRGSATGVEPGCVCPLGGPFIAICPVHYKPGGNT